MSRLALSECLTPSHADLTEVAATDFFAGILPSVLGYREPAADLDLFDWQKVSDPRCHRSLSRSGILLLRHYPAISEFLRQSPADLSRVGLYASVNQGCIDYDLLMQLANEGDEKFAEIFRRHLPPKQIFKMGLNIPAAQIGIFLGTTGPVHTFLDWRYGSMQALVTAEMDLQLGLVDLAIVMASFSLEDPLTNVVLAFESGPAAVLSEGSATLILRPGGERRDWEREFSGLALSDDRLYGNADSIIRWLRAKESL